MRRKVFLKIFRHLLNILFVILLGVGNVAFAQITIGIGEPPVGGMLLQLKNEENKLGDAANSNKGLLFTRVNLVDLNMLYPMFSVGYDKIYQDPIHTGLMVYNINADLKDGAGQGIYVWDGKRWRAMIGRGKDFSLELSNSLLVLWQNVGTSEISLITKSDGLSWKHTSSGAVGSSKVESITNGKVSTLTFTRSTVVFGDEIFTFSLTEKPDVIAQIRVSNLEVVLSKPLLQVGAGNVNGVVNSSSAVIAYGGSGKWDVLDWDENAFNWTKKPSNVDGRLQFELGAVKKAGSTQGVIRVRHLDQPGLIKTLVIEQNANYKALLQ